MESPAQRASSRVPFLIIEAVPLVGVLLLGWEIYGLMLLFWSENVISGIWRMARISFVRGPMAGALTQRLFLTCFFAVHFGLFSFVHLIFVHLLFGPGGFGTGPGFGMASAVANDLVSGGRGWALIALAIGYGIEFVRWVNGDRDTASVGKLMGAAYGRVVVLHVALIGGGFLVLLLDAPRLVMLLLVGLKIVIDRRGGELSGAR